MGSNKGGFKQTLLDEDGGFIHLNLYQDLIFNGSFVDYFDPKEKLDSIKRFQYRQGDVLICSFPKSGNHWLTNLVTLLLSKDPVESAPSVNVSLIDVANPTERLNRRKGPRIFTSHLKFERLPVEHFEATGKVILLVRNPKDVAVSWYHHACRDKNIGCTLSWDSYLKYFSEGRLIYGSYFSYLNDWQKTLQLRKDLNVLLVYYEDLKQDTLQELQRIQRYLGIYNDEDRLKSIIARCSFTSLKSDVETGRVRTMLTDKNDRPFLYRKGEIGDWMNHFTVSQNKAFDKLIQDRLKDSIFKFEYTSRAPKHRL